MDGFWLALRIVLPPLLMMAVGYLIRRTGIMNETSVAQTNRAIFTVFLPLLIFQNIRSTDGVINFDSQLFLYAVVAVIFQFLLSLCIVLLTERDNSKRGVMLQGMFHANYVLFGIPICAALFGSEAASLASLLVAVVIPIFNVLSVVSLELFNGGRPSVLRSIGGIFVNPLMIASILGILSVLFDVSLPSVVDSTIDSLAGIATPLAFVILGASFGFKEARGFGKALTVSLVMKLLVFPALFLFIAILLDFRNAPLAVLLALFASPVAVSSFTMAQQMGGDDKLAGHLVIFSSVLSIFTIFLFIFLLRYFAFL